MIEKAANRSRELFESGLYCAESVLLSITEAKGIESPLIPKIATGFCSGISRSLNLCGAVSGAIMAIGIFAGRDTPEEPVEPCYSLIQELLTRFTEKFESSNCYELIKCDLNTAEGQKTFVDNNLGVKCLQFTGEATRIAFELIERKVKAD